jgi:hypothetical protein
MKNNTITYIIPVVFALLILSFFSINASAQAAFSGGQGGGYATLPISISTSVTPIEQPQVKVLDFSVYPNPVRNDQILKAKIQGIDLNEKIKITVSDMIGSRIHSEELDALSEITINLPMDKLKKGIYLITIQHKHHKITRRFSFVE